MNIVITPVFVLVFLTGIWSCKTEPTGPETGCELNSQYDLDYHFLHASNVYDIRTNPALVIKNDTIEYGVPNRAFLFLNTDDPPYPFNEFFIDSIQFIDPTVAVAHFYKQDSVRMYTYSRNDCGIDLFSQSGNLHLELTQGGVEMTEKRYAIFDHRKKDFYHGSTYYQIDTFSFIEFRLGAFTSYDEIIRQFAADHPGEYDTVAIELVENRTKE